MNKLRSLALERPVTVIFLLITVFVAVFIVYMYLSMLPVTTRYGTSEYDEEIKRVARIAISKQDISICNTLPEKQFVSGWYRSGGEYGHEITNGRSSCRQYYFYGTNDESVCEYAVKEGWGDSCYEHLAEVKRNPAYCDFLNESPSRWKDFPLCRAKATLDIIECEALNEHEKTLSYSPKADCYTLIAERKKDYSICLNIKGATYGSFETGESINNCIKNAACDKLEERAAACSHIQYPVGTLQEKKDYCVKEKWHCPGSVGDAYKLNREV